MTPEQSAGGTLPDLQATAAPVRLRMRVDGMTCTDCERHVAQALREVGATDPVANFRRGEVHFSAPATAESQTFTAAVAQTGYRPGNVESVTPEPTISPPNGRGRGGHYHLAILGSGGPAAPPRLTLPRRA